MTGRSKQDAKEPSTPKSNITHIHIAINNNRNEGQGVTLYYIYLYEIIQSGNLRLQDSNVHQSWLSDPRSYTV